MNLKLVSHIHSFLDSFWTHTDRQTDLMMMTTMMMMLNNTKKLVIVPS